MINLELTEDEIIAVMEMLLRETKLYSFEHAPARVVDLRNVIQKIDSAVD